jgi:hypothetical protein
MDSLNKEASSDKGSISNNIKSSISGISDIIHDSEAMAQELAKNKANVSQDFTAINQEIKFNFPRLMHVPDYKKKIPTPSSLGVSSDIWASDLLQNIEILNKYLEIMMTGGGIEIGDDYCLQSGWSSNGSPKYMQVNNKPSGKVHIPGIPGYAFGAQDDMKGLIPSILEDVWEIEPANLLKYMKGEGPPAGGNSGTCHVLGNEELSPSSAISENQFANTMKNIEGFANNYERFNNKNIILCLIIIFIFLYIFFH